KIGITGVLPTQILVWDKANLEGKVTVDDPMEAVKAIVPKMKAAGADFILVAAHSGIGDNEYTKNEENEGYQIAGIEGVDAVATGHSHADFPNGDGTSFYAKYPGVDDVNGLINGKPVVMAGKFGDHLGIMDVKLTYTDGKWKVVNSKAKLEKIDTKSDVADKDLIDMAAHDHNGTINYVRKEVGETTAPITSYFAQVQDDPSIQIVNNAQLWYAKKQVAGTADENLPLLSAAAPFKAGTRGDATYYTDIPAGPLAIKNVADLYLYDNVTALLKVTGAQIKEWLEMSAGQFNQIDPNSKEPQQLINSSYRSYNYDVIDGLTYKFDLTQPNKYDREGKLVNPDASRVRDLAYQGKPIDLNQTFLVVTNNYRATGNFPGVKDAAEKRLLNLENRQAIIDYIVSEKTINPTADGNWSFVHNNTNADIRFASSDNARAHLAGQDAISYVGPSTQAGFAEYRFVVKEKANQVEDTTKKESEKSPKGVEMADQTKHVKPNA
ncbi:MAG: bifunctional 2',3'-cyclic-nucleotide 2'-phosphodiesterase/3'-nucleotidase, partial [Streptococcus salivarius]|nr:bifunctional 2',3'-cyclic-nucleotide 2'-phosphodiesterase/3'-nucleotidase [Streptococcus salivarius]